MHVCDGPGVEVSGPLGRNWFSPFTMWIPDIKLKIERLGSKHPYPPNHLSSPQLILFKFKFILFEIESHDVADLELTV